MVAVSHEPRPAARDDHSCRPEEGPGGSECDADAAWCRLRLLWRGDRDDWTEARRADTNSNAVEQRGRSRIYDGDSLGSSAARLVFEKCGGSERQSYITAQPLPPVDSPSKPALRAKCRRSRSRDGKRPGGCRDRAAVARRDDPDRPEFWRSFDRSRRGCFGAGVAGRPVTTRAALQRSLERLRRHFGRQLRRHPRPSRAAGSLRLPRCRQLEIAFRADHGRHRRSIFFAGPDAIHFFHRQDENLSLAYLSGGSSRKNRFDRGLNERVREADLESHLVVELYLDRRAAIGLHRFGLAAVAADSADGQPTHFGPVQCFEYFVEFFRSNDRYDELHISASVGVNENGALASAVRLFPVLGDVHSDPLIFLASAKRRDQCYRLEDPERSHEAIEYCSDYCNELDPELLGVAEQCPIGRVVPDFLREHSGEQRSHGSTNPVRRYHVERIIEPRARSPENGEVARNRGDC